MYPSLTETSMFLNESNCGVDSDKCPPPVIRMWAPSQAQATLKNKNSAVFDLASTGSLWRKYASLMGMKAVGYYMLDRFQLCGNCFLDGNVILSGNDMVVNYPGGASYRTDISLVSTRIHSFQP